MRTIYDIHSQMTGFARSALLAGVLLFTALSSFASDTTSGLVGRWNIVVSHAGSTGSMELAVTRNGASFSCASQSMDAGLGGLSHECSVQGSRLQVHSFAAGYAKMVAAPQKIGTVEVEVVDDRLVGNGTLYGTAVVWTGARPNKRTSSPTTHEYTPDKYITTLSGRHQPVLHIQPGDSVRTTTVDANGLDANRQWRSFPGNPHTGPFYIDGAMPGDTLVVHLTRVRTNQPLAEMSCGGINSNALPSGAGAPWDAECDWLWNLDPIKNIATPRTPSSKLKAFSVPLVPMVGSIGVAPGDDEAFSTADLRMHGGNLDYSRITEGVTLYFPVFRAGALFSLGDGHAAQGDGEVTGQGLETSLSVEFKVDLIKAKMTQFPWAEDDEYVMFSGIGNSIDDALRAATAGLIEWLKVRYQLGNADIAMILGTSLEYDVAEVVDPRPHVVARLAKAVLAQIR